MLRNVIVSVIVKVIVSVSVNVIVSVWDIVSPVSESVLKWEEVM